MDAANLPVTISVTIDGKKRFLRERLTRLSLMQQQHLTILKMLQA